MEPVHIRDDVDPSSKEYRRNLIIVILIVFALTVGGGLWLGTKIRHAEQQRDAAEQQEAVEGDGADGADQRQGQEGTL
jgi:uncharacterized protein HemX